MVANFGSAANADFGRRIALDAVGTSQGTSWYRCCFESTCFASTTAIVFSTRLYFFFDFTSLLFFWKLKQSSHNWEARIPVKLSRASFWTSMWSRQPSSMYA